MICLVCITDVLMYRCIILDIVLNIKISNHKYSKEVLNIYLQQIKKLGKLFKVSSNIIILKVVENVFRIIPTRSKNLSRS